MADYLSLTLPQLRARLNRVSESMPIGMTAVTTPEMRKKNNPFFGHVAKITRVNGWINWRYAKSVNRQRTREHKPADFRALVRSWGTRVKQTPLIQHGELYYLDVKIQQRHVIYLDLRTRTEIPWPQIKPFVRPPQKNLRQNLERDVILRDYHVENIAELRIAGEVWRVRKCWNRLQKLRQPEAAA